jgi:pyruvate dehydrogenase E2 component (dihydrolipoamide acetyltransferase)
MIPAVTNHDDADITDLEAFRVATNKENEKSGVKVTMLAFLIKACVAALKKYPEFNSSLDGDALIYKQYFHIGFAADTPNGLVVPVIKDADKKGILQISQEMGELAKKARDGKLTPAEMSGACFTISSLGGIGGRYFTPHHQCARGGDPGRVQVHHRAGVGWQGLPAAPDAAAEPDLGSPRD